MPVSSSYDHSVVSYDSSCILATLWVTTPKYLHDSISSIGGGGLMSVADLEGCMGTDPVEPLEHRAYFSVTVTDDGYVKIEQAVGDPPIYTPQEVRGLADEFIEAAERAEGLQHDERSSVQ